MRYTISNTPEENYTVLLFHVCHPADAEKRFPYHRVVENYRRSLLYITNRSELHVTEPKFSWFLVA